jgi:hypothetical protein
VIPEIVGRLRNLSPVWPQSSNIDRNVVASAVSEKHRN